MWVVDFLDVEDTENPRSVAHKGQKAAPGRLGLQGSIAVGFFFKIKLESNNETSSIRKCRKWPEGPSLSGLNL